jgi:hypothetical protein
VTTQPQKQQTSLFQNRGVELQDSFLAIKNNPLNLDLLMSHVGLLTATVHTLINDIYPITQKDD